MNHNLEPSAYPNRKKPWLFPLALVLLSLCLLGSLFFGAVAIPPSDFFLWCSGNADAQTALIIEELRLPRALLAVLIGSLLASCGTVTQGLFRNPLADPSLIGVSAGATAGASVVIVLFHQLQWSYGGLSLISLGAFIGAVIVVTFVYRLASNPNGTSIATLLLAGIAFTYLAGSFTNILEYIADSDMLKRLSLWRMGGLEAADYSQVSILAVVSVVVLSLLFSQSRALDALLLGESEARHLGLKVNRLKKLVILCVAAGVGTSVAFAGTIAFIGLIVPHVLRMLIGPGHRALIPLAACAGAILLLIADTLARTILAPIELPVGLVTALLGAPIFIALLRRHYQFGM